MTRQAIVPDPRGAIQLKVSRLKWPRLWRLLRNTAFIAAGAAGISFYVSGGSLFLNANGVVTRERIRVAAPFDARIAEIYVHPGDQVAAGQKIARVEAGMIVRSLTDIASERTRLSSKVAQLRARQKVIASIVEAAETSANEAGSFLTELKKARQNGLALWRSTQDISAAYVIAADKAASLRAERESMAAELAANLSALEEANQSLEELKRVYNAGLLVAAASGVVGPAVSVPGEVLSGQNSVTDIYIGASYVLAFIPDSYLFDISEGQPVCVNAHSRELNGTIKNILPVTEAVPPEFQIPSKVRERGQLAKIALTEEASFAIGQKIKVTGSLRGDCHLGVTSLVKSGIAKAAAIFGISSATASAWRLK
jgi:multidrug resistance efflux pump